MASLSTIKSTVLDDLQDSRPIEILQLIKNLYHEINYTKLENSMLKKFLEKNDKPAMLEIEKMIAKGKGMEKGGSKRFQSKSFSQISASRSAISKRFDSTMSKSAISGVKMEHRVSTTIKIELAEKQCNYLAKKKHKYLNFYQNKLDELTDTIEEVRETCKETKQTLNTFNEYVVLTGRNPLTKKIPTERLNKFLNDWAKVTTTETDKLRLRTITLKQKFTSQSKALIAKKELKTILRPVDFEQLKIEKTEFTHVLENRNKNFIGLKRITGTSSLMLATQSQMLLETVAIYNGIDEKIAQQEEETRKFEAEIRKVMGEISDLESESMELRKQLNLYSAPGVIEYAMTTHKVHDLEKDIKTLKREIYIATIKYNNLKKKMKGKN